MLTNQRAQLRKTKANTKRPRALLSCFEPHCKGEYQWKAFHMKITFFAYADLPTPKTCESRDFEEKLRKTWGLGSQTGKFPKYALNEMKMAHFLFQGIVCLICAPFSLK